MSQSRLPEQLIFANPVPTLKDMLKHYFLCRPELLSAETKRQYRSVLEPIGITTATIEKAQETSEARRKLKF